jgi:UDP-GlcNAc:undecaprenyl-phosphate GlcNAc-1-phosphate transferase
LAGSILGFLFYNFNPASIFMGDTGSMFLGFVLATSSIRSGQKASTAVTAVIPVIILGFPILDTLLAMSRRAIRGRPLFRADKEHIHHRLLGRGLSHRQAVLVLYGMCVLLAGVALIITYTESKGITALLVLGLAATIFVFLRWLGYIRFEVNHFLSDQRRRNRAFRVAVRPYVGRLRHAASADEIWDAVRDAASVFDAICVSLHLCGNGSGDRSETMTVFSTGFTEDDAQTSGVFFRARFSLSGEKEDEGLVELGWRDGRSGLDRDLEISIEIFCGAVSEASDRVRSRLRASARPKGTFANLSG